MIAANQGNPFLSDVRRWWATSSALVLRRHVDGGTPNSLRAVLEVLVAAGDVASSADLEAIVAVSERFRPYLNALIHGEPQGTLLTFNDLTTAIDTVNEVAQRVYAAVANISRSFDPVAQFEWTKIFTYPWIADPGAPMAYELGKPGVPYDAVPMTLADAHAQARLEAQVDQHDDESVTLTLTNAGPQAALDVRMFLPFARTVVDEDHLAPGAHVSATIAAGLAATVSGQAVIEFENQHGEVYRQYAQVVFSAGRLRRLDRLPYRVEQRIVAPTSPVRA